MNERKRVPAKLGDFLKATEFGSVKVGAMTKVKPSYALLLSLFYQELQRHPFSISFHGLHLHRKFSFSVVVKVNRGKEYPHWLKEK